jgi:hypothetical protein
MNNNAYPGNENTLRYEVRRPDVTNWCGLPSQSEMKRTRYQYLRSTLSSLRSRADATANPTPTFQTTGRLNRWASVRLMFLQRRSDRPKRLRNAANHYDGRRQTHSSSHPYINTELLAEVDYSLSEVPLLSLKLNHGPDCVPGIWF